MLRSIHPRSFALPCTLAVALGLPAESSARGPALAPIVALAPASKAAVEVNVKLDQPDDEALAARLRGEIVKALNAEGIAVTKTPGSKEGSIRIDVIWNADDNHEISAVVDAGGEARAPEGGPWVCDTCRENQLMAKVTGLLPAVIPLLPEASEEAATTDGDTGTPDDPVAPTDGGDKKRLGGLGKAGIGLLVVGVGGAITGGVLAGIGDRSGDAGPERESGTDFTTPGIATAVVGGVLAITGAAMLAVDLSRSRKKSKKAAFAPIVSPRFAGVGVSGRF